MKPGPDLVVACPRCGRRAKVPALRSGNTFGARFWTDGKVDAPMLPRRPPIAPCRGCGRPFWWHDAVVGESAIGWLIAPFALLIYGIPMLSYVGVPRTILLGVGVVAPISAVALGIRRFRQILQPPTEAHFREAIEAGLGSDRDREVELRLHAWWASNDKARGISPSKGSTAAHDAQTPARAAGSPEEANLRRLLEILNADEPEERLLKAEAARELGDFDAASRLLEGPLPDDQGPIAARIRELVEARRTTVAEIRLPEAPPPSAHDARA